MDLDRFDVARFERESERGRALLGTDPAGAAGPRSIPALGLWNGPAYDDFAYDDFVQAERTRLDEAPFSQRSRTGSRQTSLSDVRASW